jgi:hypothetical protein
MTPHNKRCGNMTVKLFANTLYRQDVIATYKE